MVNVFVELLPAFAFNVTGVVNKFKLDFTVTVTGPAMLAAFQAVLNAAQV